MDVAHIFYSIYDGKWAIFAFSMSKILPYHTISDAELTTLLQLSDHNAYAEIYNRYWAVLFRHARRMLHDDDDAQDIVQDIFVTLWTQAAEITFQSSLSAYLYTAVRNRIINLINRDKIRSNYLSSLEDFIDQGIAVTDDLILEKELAKTIEREVSLLPEKMRRAFELSRKANLSYKEISKNMNISENTVRKHITRAIKILRTKLKMVIQVLCSSSLFFH